MSSETGFERWLDRFEAPERTVCTINRTQPEPVQNLVSEAFTDQPVAVEDVEVPSDAEDVVVVVEDGDVVATSSLESLMESFLTINSDSFRTGTTGFEDGVPEVLTALDETVFEVRGYPASNKEKLLLTVISRHVERRALDGGEGTIRTLFQRLSRIDDERGTREVYHQLTDADLDFHVYGRADNWSPPPDSDLVVHEGASAPYRDSWCVVYRPPEGGPGHAALVAVKTDDNEWRGAWTYDREYVAEIDDYAATL